MSARPPDTAAGATTADSAVVESAVADAVAQAHRQEWGRVVAATVRTIRDLDLAEECVQDAYTAALQTWPRAGIPTNPAAWLTITARRRAIDLIRREQTLRAKLPLLIEPVEDTESVEDTAMDHAANQHGAAEGADPTDPVPDERLRLVFLCCHPALSQDARAALTLRLVCGIATADIARVFLVSEPTMAARITRAKRKIAGARIPFRMPRGSELPDRLRSVLSVVYLLFTTGHTGPSGSQLTRSDLTDAAIRLGRVLHTLMPDETEAAGLLALMLVIDARRATRTSTTGRLLRLDEQDRSLWDRDALAEGDALIVAALRRGQPGPYTLQAAIASLYAEPATYDDTDWTQILTLYDKLLEEWPSPVVALNRTIPLSHVAGPEPALAHVEQLSRDSRLVTYHYLPAIRADLLVRLGRPAEAVDQYRQALTLTDNQTERAFLEGRISDLT